MERFFWVQGNGVWDQVSQVWLLPRLWGNCRGQIILSLLHLLSGYLSLGQFPLCIKSSSIWIRVRPTDFFLSQGGLFPIRVTSWGPRGGASNVQTSETPFSTEKSLSWSQKQSSVIQTAFSKRQTENEAPARVLPHLDSIPITPETKGPTTCWGKLTGFHYLYICLFVETGWPVTYCLAV